MEPEKVLPNDFNTIRKLLRSMNVVDYEPRVVNQLMDFVYKYVTEILLDAECISEFNGKPPGDVDTAAIMLAIQSRAQHSFAPPPTQERLASIAERINSQSLPSFPKNKHGLLLPVEEDCITAPSYRLRVTEEDINQAVQMSQDSPEGYP